MPRAQLRTPQMYLVRRRWLDPSIAELQEPIPGGRGSSAKSVFPRHVSDSGWRLSPGDWNASPLLARATVIRAASLRGRREPRTGTPRCGSAKARAPLRRSRRSRRGRRVKPSAGTDPANREPGFGPLHPPTSFPAQTPRARSPSGTRRNQPLPTRRSVECVHPVRRGRRPSTGEGRPGQNGCGRKAGLAFDRGEWGLTRC